MFCQGKGATGGTRGTARLLAPPALLGAGDGDLPGGDAVIGRDRLLHLRHGGAPHERRRIGEEGLGLRKANDEEDGDGEEEDVEKVAGSGRVGVRVAGHGDSWS